MDFLLLIPRGVRVAIEVAGKQHYADEDRASPNRYAKMMADDRELRLTGYELFRFSAEELRQSAAAAVANFFVALFRRYGVSTAG